MALACSRVESASCIESRAFRLRSSLSGLPALTSSPRRAAFIAATAAALGSRGSKGRAFSAAIRTNSRRKASDTVRPILLRAAAASFLVRSSIRARTTAFSGIGFSGLRCSPRWDKCPPLTRGVSRWITRGATPNYLVAGATGRPLKSVTSEAPLDGRQRKTGTSTPYFCL